MTNILRIDSSARTEGSVSRQLADRFMARLTGDVTHRDLANGLPHLDAVWTGATFTPVDARSEEQTAALALSDELLSEVQAADTIVISTPIYNFTIPSTLKTWLDHLARAGVSFRYTENGPEGLLGGKRVVVVLASGGVPVGAPVDFATPYLKHMFGFLGITDVEFVGAAGAEGIATAEADLDKLAA
ncbi:FMN-dependent NADH-azoreductase [Aliiroseovarius crassostreae]|uniref:FMN-dependent NADH-azoreductase n=1 Tax=Aliiroseovarius crassostreae TaxID=154981 RepID=UPI0022071CD2|nr:NAD(P)H-dependent oxidoreductase [Aliiroseovarius crassostreae]UWP89663.1 NAD(P)H-dependent oxidoreductase [Aliiroseovarius crassostreae]